MRRTRNGSISTEDAREFVALARWLQRCETDQDLRIRFAELLGQFTPLDEVYALAREFKKHIRILAAETPKQAFARILRGACAGAPEGDDPRRATRSPR
jgi:hypothetical protein